MQTPLNQIQWLTQEQSFAFYDDNCKPKKLAMEAAVAIESDNRNVWQFLPGDGTRVEFDGLGTFQQWYGIIQQQLFIISISNHRHDYGQNYGDIRVPIAPFNETDDWSPVKLVAHLSKDLIPHITWFRSTGSGEYSLFYKRNAVVESLFCNTTKENAEGLRKYLKQQNSKHDMIIALTENFFSDWSGYKIKDGVDEFICCYSDRGTTERYIKTQQLNNPHTKFKFSSSPDSMEYKWRLMRQDDNNNEIEMARYFNHVDAKFAQLEYEKRGHKQMNWVEKLDVNLPHQST